MVWPGPRVSWPACCLSFQKVALADHRWAALAAVGPGLVAVAPAVAVREAALAAAALAGVLDQVDLAEPGPAEWADPECRAPVVSAAADPAAVFPADQECRDLVGQAACLGREGIVLRSATWAVVFQAVRAR